MGSRTKTYLVKETSWTPLSLDAVSLQCRFNGCKDFDDGYDDPQLSLTEWKQRELKQAFEPFGPVVQVKHIRAVDVEFLHPCALLEALKCEKGMKLYSHLEDAEVKFEDSNLSVDLAPEVECRSVWIAGCPRPQALDEIDFFEERIMTHLHNVRSEGVDYTIHSDWRRRELLVQIAVDNPSLNEKDRKDFICATVAEILQSFDMKEIYFPPRLLLTKGASEKFVEMWKSRQDVCLRDRIKPTQQEMTFMKSTDAFLKTKWEQHFKRTDHNGKVIHSMKGADVERERWRRHVKKCNKTNEHLVVPLPTTDVDVEEVDPLDPLQAVESSEDDDECQEHQDKRPGTRSVRFNLRTGVARRTRNMAAEYERVLLEHEQRLRANAQPPIIEAQPGPSMYVSGSSPHLPVDIGLKERTGTGAGSARDNAAIDLAEQQEMAVLQPEERLEVDTQPPCQPSPTSSKQGLADSPSLPSDIADENAAMEETGDMVPEQQRIQSHPRPGEKRRLPYCNNGDEHSAIKKLLSDDWVIFPSSSSSQHPSASTPSPPSYGSDNSSASPQPTPRAGVSSNSSDQAEEEAATSSSAAVDGQGEDAMGMGGGALFDEDAERREQEIITIEDDDPPAAEDEAVAAVEASTSNASVKKLPAQAGLLAKEGLGNVAVEGQPGTSKVSEDDSDDDIRLVRHVKYGKNRELIVLVDNTKTEMKKERQKDRQAARGDAVLERTMQEIEERRRYRTPESPDAEEPGASTDDLIYLIDDMGQLRTTAASSSACVDLENKIKEIVQEIGADEVIGILDEGGDAAEDAANSGDEGPSNRQPRRKPSKKGRRGRKKAAPIYANEELENCAELYHDDVRVKEEHQRIVGEMMKRGEVFTTSEELTELDIESMMRRLGSMGIEYDKNKKAVINGQKYIIDGYPYATPLEYESIGKKDDCNGPLEFIDFSVDGTKKTLPNYEFLKSNESKITQRGKDLRKVAKKFRVKGFKDKCNCEDAIECQKQPCDFIKSLMCCTCDVTVGCQPETCDCMKASALKNGLVHPTNKRWAIVECGLRCPCKGKDCKSIASIRKLEFDAVHLGRFIEWGLRLKQPVKRGEPILEFTGVFEDLVNDRNRDWVFTTASIDDKSEREFNGVPRGMVPKRNQYACMLLNPRDKGNAARFISHSAFPNTDWIKVFRGGDSTLDPRVFIIAIEDMEAGELIYVDYGRGYAERLEDCLCTQELCMHNYEVFSWLKKLTFDQALEVLKQRELKKRRRIIKREKAASRVHKRNNNN